MNLFKGLLFVSLFGTLNVFAETTENGATYFSPEIAAKAFASFMNESKNTKGLMTALSPAMTQSEIDGINKIFQDTKKDLSQPFPTMAAAGNQVTWKGGKIQFNKDRTFTVEGVNYRGYKPGQLDLYLKSSLEGKNKSAGVFVRMLMSDAQALTLGAVGPAGLTSELVLLGGVAVTVGVAVFYVGKEVYENYRNNEVTCNQKFFSHRKKDRGTLLLAGSKEDIIDPAVVSQILGKEIKTCDPESAKQLQEIFQAPKQVAPGAAPAARDSAK